MRSWMLALLSVTAACDGVFGLTHVHDPSPQTDSGLACPYSTLDPGGDEDGDGVLNGVDPCPLVASTDPADEDGDGSPDVCDLCPQFVMAGVDGECDGIGAACDPDDTVADRMEFYGFASSQSLDVYQATLSGGAAHVVLSSTTFASVMTLLTAPPTGTFETTFDVHDNDATYTSMSLALRDDNDVVPCRFALSWMGSSWQLQLFEGNTATLKTALVPAPASNVQFRLRGTISGTTLRAVVSGSGQASIEAQLSAPLTGLPHWGIFFYRDPAATSLTVDSDYMMLIQPR